MGGFRPRTTRATPLGGCSGSCNYGLDIIWNKYHITPVIWIVEIGDEFEPKFDDLDASVRIETLALTRLLQQFGPQLGRPRVDTLNDSRHANMKELRLSAAGGEWRFAFAFDTKRNAILRGINRVSAKNASTANWSARRRSVSTCT